MGSSIMTECSNCGDQKDYTFGVGMMFGHLDNILELFTPSIQSKVAELKKNSNFNQTDYSYELFECRHCDTAHSRLNLEITYDKNKVYRPSYKCYECKRSLKRTNRKIKSFKCRKCAYYGLKQIYGESLWD